jgi:hypothetical protein
MITRKHFLTFLATSAMTLALVTTGSLVEGKGKPGGGKNDPTLSVSLNASIEEGKSATATVTRSTSDGPVDVTLVSSDLNQASVTPATVTLIDGATTATFTVAGLDDENPNSQTVTLTASQTVINPGVRT